MSDDNKQEQRIVLFGDQRFIKEVEYVCSDILSIGGGYECVLLNEASKLEQMDGLIVLCAYDEEAAERELTRRGMKHGRDYISAMEFFLKMDSAVGLPVIPVGRKIAFWGCGDFALRFEREYLCDFYIDNNPSLRGTKFLGKPVFNPDQVTSWKEICVFIIVLRNDHREEIETFLKAKGLRAGNDYFMADSPLLEEWPSRMLWKTIHDRPMKNIRCLKGMTKIDIGPDGRIWSCCGVYIRMPMGNLFRSESALDEWNSYSARILKLSFVNHTFSFCNRKKCILLFKSEGNIEYKDVTFADGDYDNKGKPYPPMPSVAIDTTCNLWCESCRKEYNRTTEEEYKRYELLADKISRDFLPHADLLFIAGMGEVFYSPLYRKIWINTTGKKRKKIQILSNGMLFNEKNWRLLREGYKDIRLSFSIDAASKEIYEQVRRGGKWETIVSNMRRAAELRRQGEVSHLAISFVVQQKNYRDMKRFVELGKEWHCDAIAFLRISNLGTYTREEFSRDITLCEDEGIGCLKPEYREFFDDPVFDDPCVSGIEFYRDRV